MRRIILATIFALMLTGCLNVSLMLQVANPFDAEPTPTAEISIATPTGYIGTVTPIKNTVNIRGKPNTSAPIVTTLKVGVSLPVLLYDGAWYQVEVGQNAVAWVSGSVVKFEAVK